MLERKKNIKNLHSPKLIYQIWQIFFFNGLSIFLMFFFIKTGWEPINSSQIIIKGNSNFNREEVLKASGINFPKPFLEIIPKRIESNLIRRLSLKAVSIRRQISPKKIFIEVLERTPIAYAQRLGEGGLENGMIDTSAKWIPIGWETTKDSEINIFIDGWKDSHRELISLILLNQEKLGSPLEKISLTSLGEVSLQTKYFSSIKLGANPELLIDQIKILSHLSKSLPPHFFNKSGTTIDLRDPSKPELQTGKLY